MDFLKRVKRARYPKQYQQFHRWADRTYRQVLCQWQYRYQELVQILDQDDLSEFGDWILQGGSKQQ